MSLAQLRLAMTVIPAMGRNHFFALYSVVGSVVLGVSPVIWGLLIDLLRPLHWAWHGMVWNRYSVFFSGVALMFSLALALSRRLVEPQAGRMDKLHMEILIQSPQRFWLRLWPRG